MNTALWKKAFGEARLLLIVCAVGLFLIAFVRIWLVSQVEMSRFAEIIGQLWSDLEKFSLVPLSHHDQLSKTPAYKSVPVRIRA